MTTSSARSQRRAKRDALRALQTADPASIGRLFKKIPAYLKRDRQIVRVYSSCKAKCNAIRAIRKHDVRRLAGVFAKLPSSLKHDADVIKAALERGFEAPAMEYLKEPQAKFDRDVAVLALSRQPRALETACSAVRSDKLLVTTAVRLDATVLKHASKELRGDRDVVRAAAQQQVETLQSACEVKTLVCSICASEGLGPLDGYCCENPGAHAKRHFTCNDCISSQVIAEADKDVGLLQRSKGRIYCPHRGEPGCKSAAIDDAVLCRNHLSKAGYAAFQSIQKRLLAQRVRDETQREERKKFQAELERQMGMSADERAVHNAYTHVVENILTLRCPRHKCRQAFIDFDGCFALRCPRCGGAFCAACLRDCGTDAHGHVKSCTLMHKAGLSGMYYGTWETFLLIQKERKTQSLRQYLTSIQDPCLRRHVFVRVQAHIEDLHIQELRKAIYPNK